MMYCMYLVLDFGLYVKLGLADVAWKKHRFMPVFVPPCELKPELQTNSFVFVRTQKMC